MNGLVLHCGARSATIDEVRAVPTPEPTDSWFPLGYDRILDRVHSRLDDIGLGIRGEGYGLSQNGMQLFGVLALDIEGPRGDNGLSIGIRQSLDKSLAAWLAGGSNVFVCDNLCFDGNSLKVMRKNTRFVYEDFCRLLDEVLLASMENFERINSEFDVLRDIGCDTDAGYQFLGRALGHEVLTPTQANVAFREWRDPSHDDFKPRTAWSLYNAVTEGLKKGAPGHVIDRHIGAHEFFRPVLEQRTIDAEWSPVPAPVLN